MSDSSTGSAPEQRLTPWVGRLMVLQAAILVLLLTVVTAPSASFGGAAVAAPVAWSSPRPRVVPSPGRGRGRGVLQDPHRCAHGDEQPGTGGCE